VPGCRARRNLQLHHIWPRSQGGGDEPHNLTTVCFEHHICMIHGGVIGCSGQAPDRLHWELGLRDGVALLSYLGDMRLEGRRAN
jgi:hypothetical protein